MSVSGVQPPNHPPDASISGQEGAEGQRGPSRRRSRRGDWCALQWETADGCVHVCEFPADHTDADLIGWHCVCGVTW